MDFQDLRYHCEHYGCNVDHLEDNLYMVSNCVNANTCQIEDLIEYSETAVSHYFYELGIPAPLEYREALDRYQHFRENILTADLEAAADRRDEEE